MTYQAFPSRFTIPERLAFSIKTNRDENVKEILKSIDDPSIYFKLVLSLDLNIKTKYITIFFDKAKNKLEFIVSLINSQRGLKDVYEDLKYMISIDNLEGEVCYLLCILYNRIVSERKKDFEDYVNIQTECALSGGYTFDIDKITKRYLNMMKKTSIELTIEEENQIISIISPLLKRDVLIFREEEIHVLLNCGAIATLLLFCDNGLNAFNYPNLKSHKNYK
jgi:hypothetical protein